MWLLVVVGIVAGASPAQSQAPRALSTSTTRPVMTETAKIEHLIRYVATLDGAVFVRNGTDYTPKDAAEHMRSKLQAAGRQITTAKQFIDLAASRSSLTGQEYRVRLKEGKTVTSQSLLSLELERMGSSR